MDILPVDVVALVGTIMGISVVLVPIIGLTARFALKPAVEAVSRLFEHKALEDTVGILERRMALMEQQMESIEGSMKRLEEVGEFQRALESGKPPGAPKA